MNRPAGRDFRSASIDRVMGCFRTFGEYLEQRGFPARDAVPADAVGVGAEADWTGHPRPDPGILGDGGHVSERSLFRNPFKGVFKAVNPARPVSPTNSRLVASPARRRLGSQVIGR
jgi:hypothetical protein